MEDNIIPVGNTPIFERLKRELEERGTRFESLLSPKGKANLAPAQSGGISSQAAIQSLKRLAESLPTSRDVVGRGVRLAKPVQMEPPDEPKLVETFNPFDLEKQAINPDLHIQKIIKKFMEQYPDVHPVRVVRADNPDGTVTMTITKDETGGQTDNTVNADPQPIVTVKPLYTANPSHVPDQIMVGKASVADVPHIKELSVGNLAVQLLDKFKKDNPDGLIKNLSMKMNEDGSATMTIDGVKPVSGTSIGEDQPQSLYMKPSTWESDEE